MAYGFSERVATRGACKGWGDNLPVKKILTKLHRADLDVPPGIFKRRQNYIPGEKHTCRSQ